MVTPPPVALVLAGGASRRLGRPKALLEFGDRSAMRLVLDSLEAAGVRSGAVVTGSDADATLAVDPAPFAFVRNPNPAAGRMGSILAGMALAPPAADVVLWPVDRPLASTNTLAALLVARPLPDAEGHAATPWVVIPRADGGCGHPVILGAAFCATLHAQPPDASLRTAMAAPGVLRVEVPVADPGIHHNLDTDDAYTRALAWWEARTTP